jgi:replication-associated recombination protein RarA
MTSRAAENLGKRLERERVRRFVGRSTEIELFSTWLETSSHRDSTPEGQEPFSVLWVYGPGGIGKSTLLRAFAETARNASYLLAQVDGGRVMPTPDGIRRLSGSRWPLASTLMPNRFPDAYLPSRA